MCLCVPPVHWIGSSTIGLQTAPYADRFPCVGFHSRQVEGRLVSLAERVRRGHRSMMSRPASLYRSMRVGLRSDYIRPAAAAVALLRDHRPGEVERAAVVGTCKWGLAGALALCTWQTNAGRMCVPRPRHCRGLCVLARVTLYSFVP